MQFLNNFFLCCLPCIKNPIQRQHPHSNIYESVDVSYAANNIYTNKGLNSILMIFTYNKYLMSLNFLYRFISREAMSYSF